MKTRAIRKSNPMKAILSGIALALPLALQAPSASAAIAQTPLFLTTPVPPYAILNLSKDHQLFFKAYNDFSDLDGDGVFETTYRHSIDYYGYFDSNKCYSYSSTNGRFVPASITTDKYCDGTTWSGNFLNWATMSRMDVVRKLLYGGKRVVDTSSLTVLERAFLPNDAHSWAKYYNGNDINQLTPFNPPTTNPAPVSSSTNHSFPTSFPSFQRYYLGSPGTHFSLGDQVEVRATQAPDNYMVAGVAGIGSDYVELRIDPGSVFGAGSYSDWQLTNLSRTGISFCNTTYANTGDSQNVNNPPLMRVAQGNFALWSANEVTQCEWFDEDNNKQSGFTGGFRSNGNRAALSGINASAENPDDEIHGLGQKDYIVRLEACVTGLIGGEKCKKYPDGNYKPVGLLQEFGDDDQIHFGLFTGSYDKNISGGVLRKNISTFSSEVNVDTDGTFKPVSGIVSTLDALRIYGYRYNSGNHYGSGDNCTYQLTDITEGSCRSWGNPMSEIYVESLRYLAGQSPTAAFQHGTSGADAALGLTIASWQDPLDQQNFCAPLNIINFNASVSSYDDDQMSVFGDLGASNTAAELTNSIGSLEGVNGNDWFVGNTPTNSNDLCSGKTVGGLGEVTGICPEAPSVEGTYQMSGPAWWANTNRIRTDIPIPGETPDDIKNQALKVTTYGVALATNVPKIEIPVPGQERTVTILPAYRLDRSSNGSGPFGAGGLVDFKIVQPHTEVNGVGTGRFYVNWEDSEQGGDYDQDMWGLIAYRITGTQIQVTTKAVSASTANGQGFGYIISGTTQDGPHFHSGIYNFDYDDPANITVTPTVDGNGDTIINATGGCRNCEIFDPPTTATYLLGETAANLLKDPLWYTAKYGGFNDLNANDRPDLADEWDADGDSNPDNFFFATNPLELEESLRGAFMGVLVEESSAASVATNSTRLDTNTIIYQARFESDDWSGQLLAFDVNPDGSVGGELWDAGKLIPSPGSREIFTWNAQANPNPVGQDFLWSQLNTAQQTALNTAADGTVDGLGEQRLNWLRGDDSNSLKNGGTFRDRHVRDGVRIVLGDIVNSDPFFVGTPDFRYELLPEGQDTDGDTFADYEEFLDSIDGRTPMIYIGANDGMLHAFNAETGVEEFAYVPNALFDKLSALTDPGYNDAHQYYVDTTARAGDAFIDGNWRTVLVGALGAGGKAVFALDVTDPDNFDETDVLWEFTPANDTDPDDLGFTFGQPTIVRLNNGDWAAMFGNGYGSANGSAILYIVDLADGSIISKIVADDSGSNGLSTPIPVDTDSDRVTDYVYAGDLKGNMWKFNLTGANPNSWGVAWTQGQNKYPLMQAKDDAGNAQPITHRPQVGAGPSDVAGSVMVYFGTGKYFETGDNTIGANPPVHSFYGVLDRNRGTSSDVTLRADLVEQTIVFEGAPFVQTGTPIDATIRVVSENEVDYGTREGWYLDLVPPDGVARGERVVANPLLRSGRIIFTTLIPSQSPCGFGGSGWLMELDALNGKRLDESVFDLNDDGSFDSNDYVTVTLDDGSEITVPASGMQSQIGIIKTPGIVSAGDTEYKYLSGSSGQIERVKEKGSSTAGRKSWRQLR